MNNIILEKHTLPVLKSEKLLKRNKLLTIQNINKDFELENSKEYKSITSNLHEDYARIQFKEILTEAIHKGASDIHIEPFEDEIVIRIRVDGQLSKILTIATESYSFLLTVIKLDSGMNIAEKRLPQDGRMEKKIDDIIVDIRSSTIPTIYGEKMVLRILNRQSLIKEKSELGFSKIAIDKIENIDAKDVNVAIVGKYTKLEDSYISVIESLTHAGYVNNVKVKIDLIDSEMINEENVGDKLKKYNGIVVPGGFGNRGIEGMVATIKYARENNIPFLGICLGMQMTVVEFARNVLKLDNVNSEEFEKNARNKVIHIMDEQKDITKKGGTMRLGSYPCVLKENTKVKELYGKENILERHRHRFEYNNKYKEELEKAGLICSGVSPNGKLVEIVEYKNHPFFVGVQFHPELKSRPNRPAPVFVRTNKSSKRKIKIVLKI